SSSTTNNIKSSSSITNNASKPSSSTTNNTSKSFLANDFSSKKNEKRPIQTHNEEDNEIIESSTRRIESSLKKGNRPIQTNNNEDDIIKISTTRQEDSSAKLYFTIVTILSKSFLLAFLPEDNYGFSEDFLSDNQEVEPILSQKINQIPVTFNNMDDVLEVCNWLIKHPHVLKLASQMEGKTTSSLTNKNLKNYSKEKVVNDLLKHYISGTNQAELQKCGSLGKLTTFNHEMFHIHWRGKNIAQVKTLDNITKNMHVPSRSGLNIASKLTIN
ncbi:2241_t:CDS:2, partial [Cetraspora pellucida]